MSKLKEVISGASNFAKAFSMFGARGVGARGVGASNLVRPFSMSLAIRNGHSGGLDTDDPEVEKAFAEYRKKLNEPLQKSPKQMMEELKRNLATLEDYPKIVTKPFSGWVKANGKKFHVTGTKTTEEDNKPEDGFTTKTVIKGKTSNGEPVEFVIVKNTKHKNTYRQTFVCGKFNGPGVGYCFARDNIGTSGTTINILDFNKHRQILGNQANRARER